jgi:hypothetical protein
LVAVVTHLRKGMAMEDSKKEADSNRFVILLLVVSAILNLIVLTSDLNDGI